MDVLPTARARLGCVAKAFAALALVAGAQGAQAHGVKPPTAKERAAVSRAELMYLTLLGELEIQAGAAGAGFSLLMNAAQKSGDVQLFKRAIQVALQARAGDSALEAARGWAVAHPSDPEPLRFSIQALAGMERLKEAVPVVEKLLERLPPSEQDDVLNAVGQLFSQEKAAAASLAHVAPLLRRWAAKPETSGAAWAALARVEMAAGQPERALESLKQALAAPQAAEMAGLLAVDWLGRTFGPAEHWIQEFLRKHPGMLKVQLAYARQLLRQERWNDAREQLQRLIERPEDGVPPESWLMLGALLQQDRQWDAAQAALEAYLKKVGTEDAAAAAGRNQAYLALSQVAEGKKDLEQAARWLDRVTDDEDAVRVTVRRAGLLVKAGRWQEAVQLVQTLPDQPPERARARLLAEVQVLREAGQLQTAFDRLSGALAQVGSDGELLYEQATLAERLGRYADMELLLRQVMRLDPAHYHAMNFLGYSLADRNERLDEAKALIEQALSHAPNDPFIMDSLGWVLFRQGQVTQALEILQKAFAIRRDGEIALHIGEVLWVLNRRDEALAMFREANALQPDNAQLQATVRRLGVPWP